MDSGAAVEVGSVMIVLIGTFVRISQTVRFTLQFGNMAKLARVLHTCRKNLSESTDHVNVRYTVSINDLSPLHIRVPRHRVAGRH